MIFQAHRGVSTEYPENTMPAYIAAVEQGYKIIEVDVAATLDSIFVLHHDKTINRTARHKDGSVVADTTEIRNITYEEAAQYDYGMWFSQEFIGTEIPLLEDVLKFARQNNVKIKIDNSYRMFTAPQIEMLLELLTSYQDVACLTCLTVEELKIAADKLPQMHFHYDGLVTVENLELISTFLPKDRLTVWLPHKNPKTSWVTVEFASKQLTDLVKKYADVGIWILATNEQLMEAAELGADIIETNGKVKPVSL